MIHTWESIMEQVGRAVGKQLRTVAVPRSASGMISRFERLRGSITGSKPLLTPDRAMELMQMDWTCDDTRARLDIDYESSISLPDGMRLTAEWYRAHGWLSR
jgi:nucleoside-diphosphate-sugar epimerase